MDVTKIKAAIENARKTRTPEAVAAIHTEVKKVQDGLQELARKTSNDREYRGFMTLGRIDGLAEKTLEAMSKDRVNDLCDRMIERADEGAESTAKKAAKEPKADKKKETAKK